MWAATAEFVWAEPFGKRNWDSLIAALPEEIFVVFLKCIWVHLFAPSSRRLSKFPEIINIWQTYATQIERSLCHADFQRRRQKRKENIARRGYEIPLAKHFLDLIVDTSHREDVSRKCHFRFPRYLINALYERKVLIVGARTSPKLSFFARQINGNHPKFHGR